MNDNKKNQYDSILQLWNRRINSYYSMRKDTWKVTISFWAALLFFIYELFSNKELIALSASWSLTTVVFSTVSVLWGSFIWWLCNHSLSMTIERVLANNYERQLHKLSKTKTHPLDKKFFSLYIDRKNGNITLFKMPWTDKSILIITYTICLLACVLPLSCHAILVKTVPIKEFFTIIGVFTFFTFLFCIVTKYYIKKDINKLNTP